MTFVASQHLDSVRDKFYLQDFSHIGKELFNMSNEPSVTLSKLLLKPADIHIVYWGLAECATTGKEKIMKRREQTKPDALDQDQYEVQRREDDLGDHDVLQLNIKLASLKEQSLFYGDIPDDDPIDYHGVDVGHGSPEELVDAVESLITSAEQEDMSLDSVQSLRHLVTE
jgi:hypothetical protein